MNKKILAGFLIVIIGGAIEKSFNLPKYSIILAFYIIVHLLFKLWNKDKISSV